jgi:hypothetical protein
MKCVNFVCLREQSGLKGFRGSFCLDCLRSNQPPVFECQECKIAFTSTSPRLSRVPLTCSKECKAARRWKKTGKKWREAHGKNKECTECTVKYHGKLKRSTYCSKKCCSKAGYKKSKLHKLYTGVLNSMDIYMSKEIKV